MRKPILLVALCALVVIALVWLGKSRPVAHVAAVAEQSRTDAVLEPISPLELAKTAPEIETPQSMQREPATVTPEPAAPARPSDACVVFGLVVDETDRPVAGIVARLFWWKAWTAGIEAPRLSGQNDPRGWEMTTGADGRFRFEVPIPTVDTTSLSLAGDPFHDSARFFFGGRTRDAKPVLHAGDNDMGTIRLKSTGAVRGSVRDESGAPIAEARLVPGNERSTTIGREAFTDAGGNFVAGHLPAGPIGINARAEGFVSEFQKPIDVELNRYTDHVDFVLRKAPTLSGVVVDDTGRPIEGVKLWGWPDSSGSGAGGKTLADGSFTISLPQDEPYTMEATLDGFEPFGVGDRTTQYAPGTRDLRFVMKRLAGSPVLVIDAGTNQPITKFGHTVLPNMSVHTKSGWITEVRSPAPVDHPDGRVSVSFRPGIDVIDVGAPGYESQRFDPKPEPPPEGGFVVKLVQTSGVSGIVRVAGVPAAGIALRLERGRMERETLGDSGTVGSGRFLPARDGASLGTSAADGSFRMEAAQSGFYRLIARASSGEVASVTPFSVKSGNAVDLGTIDLVAGAAIRGAVLVPAGRKLAGLSVRVDDPNSKEEQVTNAEGRFRFDGLTAGTHTLFVADAPGSIAEVPSVEVQLTGGEAREVEIDARNHGTCTVDLTIVIGGRPAPDVQVELTRDTKLGRNIRLGNTNKEGHIVASAPLAQGVAVTVTTPDHMRLEHPTVRLNLTLDARIVETVRFETAAVILELPATLTMPAMSSVRLEATSSANTGGRPVTRYINIVNGTAPDGGAEVTNGGRRLRFNDVLAGDWQLVLEVTDSDAPLERVQIDARSHRMQPKKVYSGTASVKLVPGETTTVALH